MFSKIKVLLFENRTLRQTVMKNAFWLNFGEIIGRLIRAIIIIYAARVLGSAGYGVFSYALSLAAFFAILSDIGVSGILTREVAKKPDLKTQYLSTIFFIKIGLLILSIILIIFIAPIFTKIEVLPLLPIIAFLLIFDSLRDFGIAFIRALEKMEKEAVIRIFTNVAIVVFGFIAILISPTSRSLTIGYTLGSGLSLVAIIWILREQVGKIFSYFKRELIYPILCSAWPFALLGLSAGIMINTDMIMLGWFRSTEELGFYAAAYRPVQLFWIIPAILASSLFPIFSRLANKDNEKFRSIFEKAIITVLLIGLPLVAGGLILSDNIIKIIYGNEYLPSIPVFQILLLTIIFVYPGALIGNAIFAYDKQKSLIGYSLLGTLGNVFLNFLLIPYWGIVGAAYSTISTQIIINGFSWWKMKKINNFTILRHLKKIIIATLLMALFVWGLKELGANLFINLPLSILFYLSLLYLLKEPLIIEAKEMSLKLKIK